MTARRSRSLRRFFIAGSSVFFVASFPLLLIGGIVGGHLEIPWHLPAAAAVCSFPALAGAAALVLASLQAVAPRAVALVDALLPCHSARAFRSYRGGRMLGTADIADNVLWAIGGGLWALALVGPVLVTAHATYLTPLNRYAFAGFSAIVSVLHGTSMLTTLLGSGLYADDDAVARAKKTDGAPAPPPLASAPQLSGVRLVTRLLAPSALAGAAELAFYYSVGGHVAKFFQLLRETLLA